MSKGKKVLFINPSQFGYTAGYYHYCKYLVRKGFSIEYICMDNGMPKIELFGVNIKYVKFYDTKLNWRVPFYRFLRKLNYGKYNVIFLNHQRFAFIYRWADVPARTILDIRTGDLSSGGFARRLWNWLIKFDTLFYDHVTVLSESLRFKLKLEPQKCTILTLAADIFSATDKQFNDLRLLYVGTLYKRNISETIKGVSLFLKNNPTLNFCYDIIGFGSDAEIGELQKKIIKENLQGKVKFHGRKNYTELPPFFEKANIGISYIPITPYFDCQPATKTLEYIRSGMVCIATKTIENKRLINNVNGVLCEDNPESFARALQEINENNDKYNSEAIRASLSDYTWEKVVYYKMLPLFEKLTSCSD